MYNSTFICTYNFYDNSLLKINPISNKITENNNNLHEESPEELLEMAEFLYKNEFLSAFQLTDFDDTLNMKVQELYLHLFHDNKEYGLNNNCRQIFKLICKKLAEQILSEELELGFVILFSYSYFHLTHLCLCDFFNNGNISEENINALKNMIFE
jgi:hypothetical protein